MHRTQLYLPQALWKELKNDAQLHGVTMSEAIRTILTEYLHKQYRPVKKPETILEAVKRINAMHHAQKAPADLALNLDHYMYGTPKKYPTTGI